MSPFEVQSLAVMANKTHTNHKDIAYGLPVNMVQVATEMCHRDTGDCCQGEAILHYRHVRSYFLKLQKGGFGGPLSQKQKHEIQSKHFIGADWDNEPKDAIVMSWDEMRKYSFFTDMYDSVQAHLQV